MNQEKALVAGWFSFKYGHATAGDLLSRDLACAWLDEAGFRHDVAAAPPFTGDVNWRAVEPSAYSHVVFVCGPFEIKPAELEFLERFAHCRLIGLNLTFIPALDEWNPFDLLIERDSSRNAHPDMVFAASQPLVPVVGVCLVEDYKAGDVATADAAVHRLLDSLNAAIVRIDTRLDINTTGLRSPSEIESLIARVDALITTRLHGMVLALKNGVPPLAIDPETGGAKIRRQAELVGWPVIFNVEDATDAALKEALAFCLTEDARRLARECARRSVATVNEMRDRFVRTVRDGSELEQAYHARLATRSSANSVRLSKYRDALHRPEAGAAQALRHRMGSAVRSVLRPAVEPVWRWLDNDHWSDKS